MHSTNYSFQFGIFLLFQVYVAVNTSHLTLGVNDRLQATQPINPTGENDTVFYNTFIGGIVRDQQILANNAPSFTGCIQVSSSNSRVTSNNHVFCRSTASINVSFNACIVHRASPSYR